jgi:divalent metal cation (Fe/Co/Zn/Cd) transporter
MTLRPQQEGTSTAIELETDISQHRHASSDEEGMPPPRYTKDTDPFHLASKLKTEEEIRQIKANTSRKRDSASQTPKVIDLVRSTGDRGKAALTTRKLQGFYENQNENIERMLKPVEEHVREARDLNEENSLKYKIAVYASFAANIILCAVQVYGAASSGSLSLFTTMADAIFDPMSNMTLLLCNKAVNRVDPRKFPAGKARIETAGNICFCALMTAVSMIIIAFSIREIVEGSDTLVADFHLPSIIAVSVAFFTKLALFLYCFALRNQVSQIRILWEDHRNDLLINGIGVMTSILGSKVRWWIDPMGAIILSLIVSGLWLHSAYGEFQLLIGVTADTKMQQLITYICKITPASCPIPSHHLVLSMQY